MTRAFGLHQLQAVLDVRVAVRLGADGLDVGLDAPQGLESAG